MNEFVCQVIEFNKHVIGVKDREITPLSAPEARFTYKALLEESEEFNEAFEMGDIIGCVDALIDIQVFAIGALFKMGLDESHITRCMNAVCDANAQKHGGHLNKARSESAVTDAVKPEGWVGPEERIANVLDT